MTAHDDEVIAASNRFCAALNSYLNGDPAPMKDVWLGDDSVTLGQPTGIWEHGWVAVWHAWQAGAGVLQRGQLQMMELTVRTHGDVAYTPGIERSTFTINGRDFEHVSQVTDIFRKVDGKWLVVHHHVDRAPALPDIYQSPRPPLGHVSGAKEGVVAASQRFYAALNAFLNRDTSLMKDIWLDDDCVSTAHPMGTWSHGRQNVLETWDAMTAVVQEGTAHCHDLDVHLLADDIAYTTCVEDVAMVAAGKRLAFKSRATNIYKKAGDRWYMVLHHVDRAVDLQSVVFG